MSAARVVSLRDEEAVRVGEGVPDWIPLRRRLGASSFGTNAYRADRAGDVVIEDHVESPGQEELYVVITGRARITVGDEEIDAPAGTVVFVPDPDTRRAGVATEDGTIVLGVGGWPGKPYRSLPWEPIFLAREPAGRGDWAAAAETLEREAGDHRDSAIVRFRLAGYYAQLGEHDRALDELTGAIEANPAFRERAQQDELLAPLREHPRWPAG